jgi:hypothetical protein
MSRFLGEIGPHYTCDVTDNANIFAKEYPRLARLWDKYFPANQRNLQHHQTDSYAQSWLQVSRELCSSWFGREFTLDEWKDFSFGVNVICSSVYKEVIVDGELCELPFFETVDNSSVDETFYKDYCGLKYVMFFNLFLK